MEATVQLHGQYLQALGYVMMVEGRNAGIIESNPHFHQRLVNLMIKAGADADDAIKYVGRISASEAVNAQF
jgi:hypothetical protein